MINKECRKEMCGLSKLQAQELKLISKNSVNIFFNKNELIYKQGTPSYHISFLKSGIVKEYMVGPNNKEQILKITKGPSYLLIADKLRYTLNSCSASAIVPSSVCFIRTNVFNKLLQENGQFTYEVLIDICEYDLYCSEKFINQTQKQLPGRLAEAILYLSDHVYCSDSFNVNITRSELASLMGTTRESVTRVLHTFIRDGIIKFDHHSLNILNKSLLEHISKVG